ncbi:MAG: ribose-phosphate diphosphokinase [Alcanivorax sp.]|nr:ribose-phosphate diphosphokinase [Alcanivorax sp.]
MSTQPLLFALAPHPLAEELAMTLGLETGSVETRKFPDGETYQRVTCAVKDRHCLLLADLSRPDDKVLPLIFLAETLRDLGASSVGLVAPYLAYMRQDRRFHEGEAITSRVFATMLTTHLDWLVTVDPHLHRYHALSEIYGIPSVAVQASSALAGWLKGRDNLLLVGPDLESEQWVSGIAGYSGHPYVVASKVRLGDRQVQVTLPDLGTHQGCTAMIIDDVISSGHTIEQCVAALRQQGMSRIGCLAVHGVFADDSDERLLAAGLQELVTCNTIVHRTNRVDIGPLLMDPVRQQLLSLGCELAVTPPS